MDVESNITLDDEGQLSSSIISRRLPAEIILTIFFILVICVDVAIVHTIFCYKRLRTVPNILYANWVIADLLCALIAPSGYKLLTVMSNEYLSHEFLCFIEQFGATFHFAVNLFVIIVLIDWLIAAYFGRASQKFRDNYVLILGIIWAFAIVYAGTSSLMCFRYYVYFIHHGLSLLISYISAALLVIGLQISRVVQKIRQSGVISPTLNLTFGTVYVLGGLLSVIQMITVPYGTAFAEIFVAISLFGTNLVNFGILLATNLEFRTCLLMALKCRRDNDDVQFDFHNPIRNITVNKQRLESEASSTGSQEFLTQIS
ncbi:hypothetical protein RI129_006676 [Pyrocoelia pectoralis]|uniref:G-protein coupled receptors family 1 profile domain-containing protein n=1 Tax=Pyrocoelia pectoralis TaxID=417401 RepID=A0AAN7VHI8_9COLE